jgi:hypothetical protein
MTDEQKNRPFGVMINGDAESHISSGALLFLLSGVSRLHRHYCCDNQHK